MKANNKNTWTRKELKALFTTKDYLYDYELESIDAASIKVLGGVNKSWVVTLVQNSICNNKVTTNILSLVDFINNNAGDLEHVVDAMAVLEDGRMKVRLIFSR